MTERDYSGKIKRYCIFIWVPLSRPRFFVSLHARLPTVPESSTLQDMRDNCRLTFCRSIKRGVITLTHWASDSNCFLGGNVCIVYDSMSMKWFQLINPIVSDSEQYKGDKRSRDISSLKQNTMRRFVRIHFNTELKLERNKLIWDQFYFILRVIHNININEFQKSVLDQLSWALLQCNSVSQVRELSS